MNSRLLIDCVKIENVDKHSLSHISSDNVIEYYSFGLYTILSTSLSQLSTRQT